MIIFLFLIIRKSLSIKCVINRAEATEEQRRAGKGLYEKNDKNVYYEFEDKSLEEKSTVNEDDHLPIHIEHINVARVENDKEKSINDTIEGIQKLTVIENRLINNETDSEKINLDAISELPFSQNLINQSTPLDISLNTIDVNRSENDNNEGMFQWLPNNYTIGKTADNLSASSSV